MFSLSLTAWQVYRQEQTGKQWMTMLQKMVFQTYFLTLLADKPEISQLAQQRLGQVLKPLNGEQQVSMLQFFSHNGLPATFIGDALRGSVGLVEADLRQIELPQVQLAQANLSRVNFHEANLREANLSGADLSDALMEMKTGGRDAPRVQVGARRYPILRANLSLCECAGS
jgi:Pentapeptide repeats (8 copies)